MFCSNCGSKMPDGAKFCNNCGTAVMDEKSTTVVNNNQNTYAPKSTSGSLLSIVGNILGVVKNIMVTIQSS